MVRDANECEASGSVTLNDPEPIVANIISNPIQCNSNVPGSIDVGITSGGVAPFTYTVYNASFSALDSSGSTMSTGYSFTGLSYGDYYVGIVDANGCEFLSDLTRIETPPNISLIGNTSTGTCVTGERWNLRSFQV